MVAENRKDMLASLLEDFQGTAKIVAQCLEQIGIAHFIPPRTEALNSILESGEDISLTIHTLTTTVWPAVLEALTELVTTSDALTTTWYGLENEGRLDRPSNDLAWSRPTAVDSAEPASDDESSSDSDEEDNATTDQQKAQSAMVLRTKPEHVRNDSMFDSLTSPDA